MGPSTFILKSKVMNQMDTERIIKLLKLSTSPNDNEALSAIRMANKILAAVPLTWDMVSFKKETPKPVGSEKTAPVDKMFDVVLKTLYKNPRYNQAVQVLWNTWSSKRSLKSDELSLLMQLYSAAVLK